MRQIKAYPVLTFLICTLALSGCFSFEPTYSKEKIEEQLVTLCKTEYNIEPSVTLVAETVWIYMPFSRIIASDNQLDKDFVNKLNKVMMGASRVLLSMKPRPRFMVVVASDIKEYGLDYTMITWIPDMVKYQMQFISWDEYNRRTVVRATNSILALGDTSGTHIEKNDIKIGDFLAQQIAQRIANFFQGDELNKYFKVEKSGGTFDNGTFIFAYSIKEILKPGKNINVMREMLKIITYCIKTYEFQDFSSVEISDLLTQDKLVLSRQEIWARPMPVY